MQGVYHVATELHRLYTRHTFVANVSVAEAGVAASISCQDAYMTLMALILEALQLCYSLGGSSKVPLHPAALPPPPTSWLTWAQSQVTRYSRIGRFPPSASEVRLCVCVRTWVLVGALGGAIGTKLSVYSC